MDQNINRVRSMDEEKPKKRRYRALTIAVFVVGLIAAIVATYAADHVVHTASKDARLAGVPLPVQTVPAQIDALHATVGGSGMVEPSMPVNLSAAVTSRVVKVLVDLGTTVRPGNTLVELDRRLFEAKLGAARAEYDYAENQLERAEALMERQFGAEVDLEKARSREAMAREALVQSEIDLENTRVISPVAGIVLDRNINPGENTKPGQPLIQLGVLEPAMMVAQIPEDRIGDVYLGMKARVGTDAFPGLALSGTVRKIDFKINEATRTFGVFVQLDDPSVKLRKGVTGYSTLESTRMALSVPDTAVMNPVGDRAAIFVVDKNNTAHMRMIRRGFSLGGRTEVLDGLDEGESVVTVGQFDLRDNDRVSANRFAPWNQKPYITRSSSRPPISLLLRRIADSLD
jgi:membrane fusion protein, multidrug efflux system